MWKNYILNLFYFFFIDKTKKGSYSLNGSKEGEKPKRGRPKKFSGSISVDGKLFIFIVYFISVE